MESYRHRIMDDLLKRKLQAKGAVLIEGPKWCGKTTTAEEIAASKVLLARTDTKESFRSLLEIDMDTALAGAAPMLIDEWQTVPKLWDAVRYTVDHRRTMGQFILTGSAVPDKKAEEERKAEEAKNAPPTQEELLTDILAELRAQNGKAE